MVTPETMAAAYDFLKRVSFDGLRLPATKRVTFVPKRLIGYHGYYIYPDHIIIVNTCTKSVTGLLHIMAHEMIHAVLEQNASCDHAEHDENFKALARIVEFEMGWPKGSV